MNLVIPANWSHSSNFGDALTPYLIKKISGYSAAWVNHPSTNSYVVTGSILGEDSMEYSIVWGAGVAWANQKIIKPHQLLAVRGPLTKRIAEENKIECPSVFGDPALLLPRFYTPKTEKKYKLGIIPHVIDYEQAVNYYSNDADVVVINLWSPIEEVIETITACDKTVSSSLHGIIVSQAYGIDSLWIELSDKIIGDGTKYHDYLESVGMKIYKPLDVRKRIPVDKLFNAVPDYKIEIDLDLLYNACPFKPEL